MGRPDVAFRFRLITTVITVAGFVLAVQTGQIVVMAAAYVIPGYLLLPLNLLWMQRYAGIGIRAYLGRLRGVVAATIVMALVMIGGRYLLGEQPPVVILVTLLGIAAISYLGALWLADRDLVVDVLGFARRAIPGRRRGAPRDG